MTNSGMKFGGTSHNLPVYNRSDHLDVINSVESEENPANEIKRINESQGTIARKIQNESGRNTGLSNDGVPP